MGREKRVDHERWVASAAAIVVEMSLIDGDVGEVDSGGRG